MEVEILFKETIKPSSSTPKHLRSYKLSLLDQLAPPIYIPVILFYSSTSEISLTEKSDRLRKSLSETLTLFYPLAGRVKDIYSIDCNDEGVSYTEAHVVGDMSLIVQDPQVPQLEKLLPFNQQVIMSSDDVILGVQVNHFDCGGMAISICISHRIADASAAASFVTSWARVASDSAAATNIEGTVYDYTSIFPPRDIRSFSWNNRIGEKDLSSHNVMKRFVFVGSKLSALQESVVLNDGTTLGHSCLGRPSRVETLAALIWGTFLDLTKEEDENSTAAVVVDLRRRLIPPLPQLSLGNICQGTTSTAERTDRIDYNDLASKIHESIGRMKDGYVRKMHEGGMYFEAKKNLFQNPNRMKFFGISSWCRFPFYESDFGWGKPIWLTTTMKINNGSLFIDTKDGEEIEALVVLPKEDMTKFEQNPDICFYASFNPSI